MTPPRQTIREHARLALLGRTRAADRISTNRKTPLIQCAMERGEEEQLPALLIYVGPERSEIFDESPRRYRRRAELTVEALAEVVDNLDDEIDEFCQEVETALLRDDTLGGILNDLRLTGTNTAKVDTGAKLLGAAIITLEAEYFTEAPIPGSDDLDDFVELRTSYSLDGQQAEPEQAKTILEDLNQ
jgi:hypothetical protein